MPALPAPTEVERAYAELRARLNAIAAARPYCPAEVYRNRTFATLMGELDNGTRVVWNLIEMTGELQAEEIGDGLVDGPFEIIQPAMLEIAICEADDAVRDQIFDANLVAVRDFIRTLQEEDATLGGLIDHISINQPPERLIAQGIAGIKAVRIRIEMLMDLSTVLG